MIEHLIVLLLWFSPLAFYGLIAIILAATTKDKKQK